MLLFRAGNVFLTSSAVLPGVHHNADAICHRSDLSRF